MEPKTCPLSMFASTLTGRLIPGDCIRDQCAWWCNQSDQVCVDRTTKPLSNSGNTQVCTWYPGVCAVKALALHTLFDRALREL